MAEVRYAVLGSGSRANSYIFEYEGFSCVVDNGYTQKEWRTRALEMGFQLEKVGLILLTHIHNDHVRGVAPLSRACHCPVMRHHHLTTRAYSKNHFYQEIPVIPGQKYTYDKVQVIPFNTSHDAPHPLGFTFKMGDTTFTVITDTGNLSREMFTYATHSQVLFLESNYSPPLLDKGPYPEALKERIRSPLGHLSNHEAGHFSQAVVNREESRLQEIYFCHISENNNTLEQAKLEIGEVFSTDKKVTFCPRNVPVPGRI